MAAPLTIDNFEFDKLRAKSPESKKGGNITYYSVPFEYEDGKSLLKTEGNFRVFRHKNKEGISYSLLFLILFKCKSFDRSDPPESPQILDIYSVVVL